MELFKYSLKIKIPALLLFFLISENIFSQDLHYSQFYNSPQNINPALTGVFNGDHRITVSMRDQWRFVPVPWFTLSAAYDTRLNVLKGSRHFLAGGLSLNHDRQGASRLNLTSLNLNVAYHRILATKHILSGGIIAGFASRGFNSQTLTWDKQWNGDSFDPNASSGEDFGNFERINFPDLGLGINYRFQVSTRTFLDAGMSMLHLHKPDVAFITNEDIRLPRRFTYSATGQAKLASFVDLQLQVLHQVQGPYDETVLGGLFKFHLSEARGKSFQLHAGLGYRTAKSLFPIMALQLNNIYVSMSYDLDTNAFNTFTNNNKGGPEIHVRYIIANVAALRTTRVCPIY
jgi:type IX secretion system PorP/SprF family membrane protein